MHDKKRRISVILIVTSIVCLIVALVLLLFQFWEDQRSRKAIEDMRTSAQSVQQSQTDFTPAPVPVSTPTATKLPAATSVPTASPVPTPVPTATPLPTPVPVSNPYESSFLANSDMVAWLKIPDTVIDYPVMWTPSDEEYYLDRAFDGSKNKNGCLLLDTDSNLSPLTTNLIIHGHNMKSGAMFGTLTKYEKESFYQDHKTLSLYTKECQKNYEILAVFRSQVYRTTDKVFKFYQFFDASTEEEFQNFYDNIKALSLYDTGVTAEYGDHFITLSTCVYHVENGRFVVVAKEVESGDCYLPFQ